MFDIQKEIEKEKLGTDLPRDTTINICIITELDKAMILNLTDIC